MKRDPEQVARKEAATIAALDRIREGRTVHVCFVQHPYFSVCGVVGKWIPRRPPTKAGWMVWGKDGAMAIILPTDQISVLRQGAKITLTVMLAGMRMPTNAASIRRARIAGIINDDPPDGGAA